MNGAKLKALRLQLSMTQTEVAEYLAAATRRPCTLRTIQSWEADPGLSSSRGCPEWAITVLAEKLAGSQPKE
jgi:transcriptional regulator with XRE-family HTH domain